MLETLSRRYYNLGLRLAREGEISAAARVLARAVSYDGANQEAWNLAGLCYYRLGSFQTALLCWTRSLSPSAEGNPAAACLSDLRRALAESAPHFAAVTALCENGKHARAAALVEAEIRPRLGETAALLNFLGVLYALGGKPSAAARCWKDTLSLDRGNPSATAYLSAVQHHPACRLLELKERLKQKLRKKK